jgi:predicted nucleic acid-binding Zn ribbon protein
VPDDDRAARAAQALAAARTDARDARGAQPQRPARPAESPAPRRQLIDPAPLDTAITGLIADTGWEKAVSTASVLSRWAQIVGPELAAHASPGRLADGELEVLADSTAWATQLRLLAGELVRKLNAELGDGSVIRVKVHGPGAHQAQAGRLRVRGGRGPRDTYG